ncbi:hypothetical protein GCM10022205_49430 [Spinactinospora alkalitolerans]
MFSRNWMGSPRWAIASVIWGLRYERLESVTGMPGCRNKSAKNRASAHGGPVKTPKRPGGHRARRVTPGPDAFADRELGNF